MAQRERERERERAREEEIFSLCSLSHPLNRFTLPSTRSTPSRGPSVPKMDPVVRHLYRAFMREVRAVKTSDITLGHLVIHSPFEHQDYAKGHAIDEGGDFFLERGYLVWCV